VKTILKLIVVGLLANAGFRVSQAWLSYYKFTDAVGETAQYGPDLSPNQLHARIMELASQYSVPLADEDVTIRRDSTQHTFVDGTYIQPLDIFTSKPPKQDELGVPARK
jgi:hypothetical protein